jgi:hypothetical protein
MAGVVRGQPPGCCINRGIVNVGGWAAKSINKSTFTREGSAGFRQRRQIHPVGAERREELPCTHALVAVTEPL